MIDDKITLYYFPLNIRGALIRALLSLSKLNWENRIVNFEEWPSMKISGIAEYRQLPILEINGKYISQSLSIEVYLSKKYGLFGSNLEEETEIMSIVCSREDFYPLVKKTFYPISTEEKAYLEETKRELFTKVLPNFLRIYEERLTRGKGRYIVGDKLSLADIYLSIYIHIIFHHNDARRVEFGNVLSENAPNLLKYKEEIKRSDLKEFFEKFYLIEANI